MCVASVQELSHVNSECESHDCLHNVATYIVVGYLYVQLPSFEIRTYT